MESRLPEQGDMFDARYRVEAIIGHGGFGRVYRARDEKLGRPVALKVLHVEPGSDDRIHRFWRETDLSRRLMHPHTVRVYDFGIAGNGVPFIAFELLDGESLARRSTRSGAMPVVEVRRIAVSVLKSLMEAHALGIVHRDIKPANVFLCNFAGEVDFVKVLDFGIAKAPHEKRDLTAHGWLVGTPMYMAPEQIAGRELTARADLYSLGLLMVTMLTNRPLLSGSTHEVIAEQLSDEPLKLPAEVLASPLGSVIRRATEKDPARRYASAAEMLGDLEGITPIEPTRFDEPALPRSVAPVAYALVPNTPPPAPVPRSSRMGWVIALGAALAIILLFGAVAVSVAALSREPRVLESGMATLDPALSPAVVQVRAKRAGIELGTASPISEHAVDRSFSSNTSVGVIRFEEHPTLALAEDAEQRAQADAQRATLRRGRRLVSVWASKRGHRAFDRELGTALLTTLVPGENHVLVPSATIGETPM